MHRPTGGTGDVHRELMARFGSWHEPIAAIIEATPADRILRTDIYDREPIERWHAGRVVLLGDAAHPMTPNLGQGRPRPSKTQSSSTNGSRQRR